MPCERKKQRAAEGKMRERHFCNDQEKLHKVGLEKPVEFQDENRMRRCISGEGNDVQRT